MILSLILLIIAFTWLLKETDYLRIKLLSGLCFIPGDCCKWRLPDSAVTDDMKRDLINSWTHLPKEIKCRFLDGIESPLCGWGYAYQYRDYEPECLVEMNIGNVRYKMTIKTSDVLTKVMKVNRLSKAEKKLMYA